MSNILFRVYDAAEYYVFRAERDNVLATELFLCVSTELCEAAVVPAENDAAENEAESEQQQVHNI